MDDWALIRRFAGEGVPKAQIARRLGRHGTPWPGRSRRRGRGVHVFVPLEHNSDALQARAGAGAVAVARELERRRPDLITAAWWKDS